MLRYSLIRRIAQWAFDVYVMVFVYFDLWALSSMYIFGCLRNPQTPRFRRRYLSLSSAVSTSSFSTGDFMSDSRDQHSYPVCICYVHASMKSECFFKLANLCLLCRIVHVDSLYSIWWLQYFVKGGQSSCLLVLVVFYLFSLLYGSCLHHSRCWVV